MFRPYKEIWYGVFFGIGAILIDAKMHSRMTQRGFWEELTTVSGEMVIYRVLFLAFGIAIGWLLWRNSHREREFRELETRFARLQGRLSPLITVSYSRLEIALTRPESEKLPKEIVDALHAAHEDLRRLRTTIIEEASPPNVKTS